MGPKAWITDPRYRMGIFSHVNIDILGHYWFYPGGRLTRKNAARKVWVLVIICLYSKAITMVLMRDYSSEAFKMSMTSHFYRYGTPAVLTMAVKSESLLGTVKPCIQRTLAAQ